MSKNTSKGKAMRKRVHLSAAFLLIFLMSAAAMPGLEDDDSTGVCERALNDCINDVVTQASGPFGAVICIVGYAFCKKYIDPSFNN
jgi:hypothetical protein